MKNTIFQTTFLTISQWLVISAWKKEGCADSMTNNYTTSTKGSSALPGILFAGFQVYGPEKNGKEVSNADLDTGHGHNHATTEYPDGIYHYHITATSPYINGDGDRHYRTPVTVIL